ncbi:MAG TPA: hypothetical protein VK874_11350 [Gaiellaceae bacterium]|nr:hypothetical protein [Gaiellaceae bacterium]
MRKIVFLLMLLLPLGAAAPAEASRYARYGVQDDAWLASGPGTLEQRLDLLEKLGVDLVRYTIRWDQVAQRRPANARSSADPAYAWGAADDVLRGLRERRIATVVTLLGTPRWANGGRAWQVAPTRGGDFAAFAVATARRYPWTRDWTIWNEPNQRRWLSPVSARTYVQRLLNPAYTALKGVNRGNRVAGGVTAPRGNSGGLSPVAFIRGMKAARARLDAYAHHPYPTRPRQETPRSGGCARCTTITMATLDRLIREVQRAWPRKRIWLTEYGYQTRPPDRALGVTMAQQARYLSEAAHKVWTAPYVDMLVNFLVRDDRWLAGWQSGVFSTTGVAKPAYNAFRLPLAQVSRRGLRTVVWGQVRPRSGKQPYRIRQLRDGRWHWVGGNRWTSARGAFSTAVRAGKGSRLQLWSPRDRAWGVVLTVR